MASELIDYSVRNAVGWITLNRPDRYNALNRQMAEELRGVLHDFERDQDVRCGVLRGAGRGFCAGGDITMFPDIDSEVGFEFTRRLGRDIYMTRERLSKPLLGAVHGACVAGGLELALMCHTVFASQSATFGMAELQLGLIPGWGGTVRLARAVPTAVAVDMLLTSRRLTAGEAVAVGLVARVFDDEQELFDVTDAVAQEIASRSPVAVELALQVTESAATGRDAAYSLEQVSTALLFGSKEAQASIRAVLDRGVGKKD